jgi:hypothetical protein
MQSDNTVLVPLTQGKFALIDAEDAERILKNSWALTSTGYAYRGRVKGEVWNSHNVRMHRLVINAPDGVMVDHINGDKLDNRKSNLRLATRSQNLANGLPHKDSQSGVKGVDWSENRGKWRVRVGKTHIGRFDSIEDATRAYNEAAQNLYGEFARLNPEA